MGSKLLNSKVDSLTFSYFLLKDLIFTTYYRIKNYRYCYGHSSAYGHRSASKSHRPNPALDEGQERL